MADTPNYHWEYPTVNASADTWGTTLNDMAIAIDATVKANADAAAAAVADRMPIDDATATGTFTGPDGGAWDSSGLNGLDKLGIGMTAANPLDITKNQNAGTRAEILNNNASSGAYSAFRANNGTARCDFEMLGTGNSTFPNYGGASSTHGLLLGVGSSYPLAILRNGAEQYRFGSDGSFLVGSTTNAGAGAIAATGNITAFYSDDRLKTRQGNIEGALGKVLSLQGFYYGPNDTARDLGYDYEREVGISAQDVQKVMPEVIAPAPIDPQYMTVRYDRLIPLLIEAIKELDAKKADA